MVKGTLHYIFIIYSSNLKYIIEENTEHSNNEYFIISLNSPNYSLIPYQPILIVPFMYYNYYDFTCKNLTPNSKLLPPYARLELIMHELTSIEVIWEILSFTVESIEYTYLYYSTTLLLMYSLLIP